MEALGSPRQRRRLAWIGGLLLVAGIAAAAIVALPKGHESKEVLRPGAVVLTTPKDVPMTRARREAVDRVLDAFVPAAVERRDPMRALPLVTTEYRAGVTNEQWSRGNLPVFPFQSSNRHFHDWTLHYSYANEMSIEILLHPAKTETLGAQAFTVVLKRSHDRWLIDSFAPSASFAPAQSTPRIRAQPDYTPFATDRGRNRLSTTWLLVPAAVLALIILVPIGIGIGKWRRSRRAWREYHASQARLD